MTPWISADEVGWDANGAPVPPEVPAARDVPAPAHASGCVGESHAREAEAKARAYEVMALAFAPPCDELARALNGRGGAHGLPDVDVAALATEHARLFVGPGKPAAPPFGSVYHEGNVLMGESTVDAVRQYREAGFTFSPERGELPDHVVSELSFLSVLAEEEAQAWRAGDHAAARACLERRGLFLWDHLGAWAPDLSQRILAATDEPFYRAVAVRLRELVAVDLEYVTRLVAPDRAASRDGATSTHEQMAHTH